jgi:hypothetical protein
MGEVHTQTIEGFWSLVKRGIGGVYHSVSRKYLQTYRPTSTNIRFGTIEEIKGI